MVVSPGTPITRVSTKHREEFKFKKKIIQECGSFVLYTSFEFATVGNITFSIWDV
jgi:hypothetical protein